ncbi:MAG TPA: spore maturation protein [Firmicutes bacterium]|nr:spore maturation protein [Bacillota bacterium]
MDLIWLALIVVSVVFGWANGAGKELTAAVFAGAAGAVDSAIQLLGIVTVWMGISRVAEKSGLLQIIARAMAPVLRPLFPDLPKGHPAFAPIAMNFTANILGLGNAATPFGLIAMKELQASNPHPAEATRPMITFLALNSVIVTLVPSGTIAFRAATGAANPSDVVLPAILATAIPMVCVIFFDLLLRRFQRL